MKSTLEDRIEEMLREKNREAERVRDELLVIRRITEIMELGGNA